jgi:hypothetical protein
VALMPAGRGRSKRATPDGLLDAFDGDKLLEPRRTKSTLMIYYTYSG